MTQDYVLVVSEPWDFVGPDGQTNSVPCVTVAEGRVNIGEEKTIECLFLAVECPFEWLDGQTVELLAATPRHLGDTTASLAQGRATNVYALKHAVPLTNGYLVPTDELRSFAIANLRPASLTDSQA